MPDRPVPRQTGTRRPWDAAWRQLVEAAARAMAHARGRPARGAAVDCVGADTAFAGCAVSERDLPAASLCAESAALARACVEGAKAARRLVVIGPPPHGAPPPCGRCLQVLMEFGGATEIRWGTRTREHGRGTLATLLPRAFTDYRPPGGGGTHPA